MIYQALSTDNKASVVGQVNDTIKVPVLPCRCYPVSSSVCNKDEMNLEFHSYQIEYPWYFKYRIWIFSDLNSIRLLNSVEMSCRDTASSLDHGHKPETSAAYSCQTCSHSCILRRITFCQAKFFDWQDYYILVLTDMHKTKRITMCVMTWFMTWHTFSKHNWQCVWFF